MLATASFCFFVSHNCISPFIRLRITIPVVMAVSLKPGHGCLDYPTNLKNTLFCSTILSFPSQSGPLATALLFRCQILQAPLFPFRHTGGSMEPLLRRHRHQLNRIGWAADHADTASNAFYSFSRSILSLSAFTFAVESFVAFFDSFIWLPSCLEF